MFWSTSKNYWITYDNNGKIEIDQADGYTTSCFLNPVAIFSFTGNLDRAGNTTMFLIIKEVKETILDFSQKTVMVL